MDVLLELVAIPEPTRANKPYYFLRGILFIFPTVSVWFISNAFLEHDVALTITAAFLSVQLVGPWDRWRTSVVMLIRSARQERTSPLRFATSSLDSLINDRGVYLPGPQQPSYADEGVGLGPIYYYPRGIHYPRPWPIVMRLRISLHPAWRRWFRDAHRAVIQGHPMSQSAFIVGSKFGVLDHVYRWRARRTLQKVGRLLMKMELWRDEADAPARKLARFYALRYKPPWRSQIRRKYIRMGYLYIAWILRGRKGPTPRETATEWDKLIGTPAAIDPKRPRRAQF